ncbi:hypothetical protein C8J57DRAFT_1518054 [Mycena rebaudengoi]|nr:hypothetical protein C8J57DRAFT_1518054 [Mycena rebaudengoi]
MDRVKEAPYSIDDPRFVMIVVMRYLEDWLVGANGGTDFWVRAELFVAKKRRGEIQPATRCRIEESDSRLGSRS